MGCYFHLIKSILPVIFISLSTFIVAGVEEVYCVSTTQSCKNLQDKLLEISVADKDNATYTLHKLNEDKDIDIIVETISQNPESTRFLMNGVKVDDFRGMLKNERDERNNVYRDMIENGIKKYNGYGVKDIPSAPLVLKDQDGNIAAYTNIKTYTYSRLGNLEQPTEKDTVYLDGFLVFPNFQRKKLATNLLNLIKTTMSDSDAYDSLQLDVDKENTPMQAVINSLGARSFGTGYTFDVSRSVNTSLPVTSLKYADLLEPSPTLDKHGAGYYAAVALASVGLITTASLLCTYAVSRLKKNRKKGCTG